MIVPECSRKEHLYIVQNKVQNNNDDKKMGEEMFMQDAVT